MSPTPPGWYPDPAAAAAPGALRWWDGAAWGPSFEATMAQQRPDFVAMRDSSEDDVSGGLRDRVRARVAEAFPPHSVAPQTAVGYPPRSAPRRRGAEAPLRRRQGGDITDGGRTPRLAAVGVVIGAAALSTVLGLGAVAGFGAVLDAGRAPSTQPEAAVPVSESPVPTPVETLETVVETEVIPFGRVSRDDPSQDVGSVGIVQPGVDGERRRTVEIVRRDGVEVSRTTVSEEIARSAVDEVTAVGSRKSAPAPDPAPVPAPAPAPAPAAEPDPAPDPGNGCHGSYSGVCVPITSDVDCAGGSGNGPEYVRGPLSVVGPDVYDLDRDGDGVACD